MQTLMATASHWTESRESFLESGDGVRLFVRSARVAGDVRANVVLTHGLGEHSARYGHVAGWLANQGLRLCAWDLRGHGRSSGVRGDVSDYNWLVEDLRVVLDHFRLEEVPTFLFAHSLGGQIALRFLERHDGSCRGAVIASPWLRLAFAPPRWRVALAQAAMRVWPAFSQKTDNSRERLSRDFEHLASLPDLDLVHHRITARMYFSVQRAGEEVLRAAGRVRTPLLLLHGDADVITSWEATREFHERAGAVDKTLRLYPGVRHEAHNDLGRERVLRDVCEWIEARL